MWTTTRPWSAPSGDGGGGPKVQFDGFKDATGEEGSEELNLRIGKDEVGRRSWTQRGLIGICDASPVDSERSALCQKLYDGVEQEVWECVYSAGDFAGDGEGGGYQKSWRAHELAWKLSERNVAGDTFRRKRERSVSKTTRKSERIFGKGSRHQLIC